MDIFPILSASVLLQGTCTNKVALKWWVKGFAWPSTLLAHRTGCWTPWLCQYLVLDTYFLPWWLTLRLHPLLCSFILSSISLWESLSSSSWIASYNITSFSAFLGTAKVSRCHFKQLCHVFCLWLILMFVRYQSVDLIIQAEPALLGAVGSNFPRCFSLFPKNHISSFSSFNSECQPSEIKRKFTFQTSACKWVMLSWCLKYFCLLYEVLRFTAAFVKL